MNPVDKKVIEEKLHLIDYEVYNAQRAGDKQICAQKIGEFQGISWMLALMGYSPEKVNGVYQLRPLGSPE